MKEFGWIWAWLSLMFPLAYSAGPNTLLCASTGMGFGFKKTLPLIAGINASLFLYSLTIGFLMQVILISFPPVIDYLKIIGALYIFWLAWLYLKPINKENEKVKEVNHQAPGFWKGFLISALNPKLITALFVMFSQFLDYPEKFTVSVIMLTIMTIILSLGAHFLYTIAGNILRSLIKNHQNMQRYIFSGMLVLAGIWMLF